MKKLPSHPTDTDDQWRAGLVRQLVAHAIALEAELLSTNIPSSRERRLSGDGRATAVARRQRELRAELVTIASGLAAISLLDLGDEPLDASPTERQQYAARRAQLEALLETGRLLQHRLQFGQDG